MHYTYCFGRANENDLRKLKRKELKTINGFASNIEIEGNGWINFCLSRKRYRLRILDIFDEVVEYFNDGEFLELFYWEDTHGNADIIYFRNIDQYVSIGHQKNTHLYSLYNQTKARRYDSHLLLSQIPHDGHIFVLVKKNSKSGKSELVDVCGDTPTNSRSIAINMLERIGVVRDDAKKIADNIPVGELRTVGFGNDEYMLGAFRVTNKIHDCSCGAARDENNEKNHSLVANCGTSSIMYLCEYCFFDMIDIVIPSEVLREKLQIARKSVAVSC